MKQRLFPLLAEAVAAALGSYLSYQLTTYDVPLAIVLACGLALYSTFRTCLHEIADASGTVTHRCTAPGCDFTVKLTHCEPGETRRWQEIAATHPHHA